jgi:5-methylcytosine-specific restriction endonuclease McrA
MRTIYHALTWPLWTLLALAVSLTMRPGVRYGGESFRWAMCRAAILERDGHRCRHCGARAQYGGTWLEIDHKRRVADGGSYRPWNLRALCKGCHDGRHGRG